MIQKQNSQHYWELKEFSLQCLPLTLSVVIINVTRDKITFEVENTKLETSLNLHIPMLTSLCSLCFFGHNFWAKDLLNNDITLVFRWYKAMSPKFQEQTGFLSTLWYRFSSEGQTCRHFSHVLATRCTCKCEKQSIMSNKPTIISVK